MDLIPTITMMFECYDEILRDILKVICINLTASIHFLPEDSLRSNIPFLVSSPLVSPPLSSSSRLLWSPLLWSPFLPSRLLSFPFLSSDFPLCNIVLILENRLTPHTISCPDFSYLSLLVSPQTYQHTVLLVSHDRSFLNEVCTDVMLFKNLKLTYFRGNYDAFESTDKEMKLVQQRQHESQMVKVQHMQVRRRARNCML